MMTKAKVMSNFIIHLFIHRITKPKFRTVSKHLATTVFSLYHLQYSVVYFIKFILQCLQDLLTSRTGSYIFLQVRYSSQTSLVYIRNLRTTNFSHKSMTLDQCYIHLYQELATEGCTKHQDARSKLRLPWHDHEQTVFSTRSTGQIERVNIR